MKDIFVDSKIAKILKEKLFDEPCIGFYEYHDLDKSIRFKKFSEMGHQDLFSSFDKGRYTSYFVGEGRPKYFELEGVYQRPLISQVIDWLDDVHKIRVDLTHASSNGAYKYTIWKWSFDNNVGNWEKVDYINSFVDKKERNIKAIESALKLI